ncbi:unnamed protein product, partial [Iphiclides podalirius]
MLITRRQQSSVSCSVGEERRARRRHARSQREEFSTAYRPPIHLGYLRFRKTSLRPPIIHIKSKFPETKFIHVKEYADDEEHSHLHALLVLSSECLL